MHTKKRVSIGDIARELDLAPSTVSVALRGGKKVKAATRQKVEAKARALGYRPNPRFSALVSLRWQAQHQEDTIAILCPKRASKGWEVSVHGAEIHAAKLGYQTERFVFDPEKRQKRLADILYHRGIKAIFLPNYCRLPCDKEFPWENFAVVAAADRNMEHGVDVVRIDPFGAVFTCGNMILSKGWKRIGAYFPHDPPQPSEMDIRRMAAFDYWQRTHLPESDWVPVCTSEIGDIDGFIAWFEEHRPEALLSLSRTPYYDAGSYFPNRQCRPPMAALSSPLEDKEVAGCSNSHTELQQCAIEWLDQKLRMGRRCGSNAELPAPAGPGASPQKSRASPL